VNKGRLTSADTLSGLLFTVLALGFIINGQNLTMGTASRMGPGWFPMAIALCLLATGLIITARSLVRGSDWQPSFKWMPLALIALGLGAFALALKPLGLLLAATLTVLISAHASPPVNLRRMVPYALAVGIANSIIFVKWLGLPIPIIGTLLTPVLGYW